MRTETPQAHRHKDLVTGTRLGLKAAGSNHLACRLVGETVGFVQPVRLRSDDRIRRFPVFKRLSSSTPPGT